MTTLGDLLAAAKSADMIARWLREADPDLAETVGAAAAREGETPDSFARIAVADFAQAADEEAWTTLISRIRSASDPGLACLSEMLRWRLSRAGGGSEPPHRQG